MGGEQKELELKQKAIEGMTDAILYAAHRWVKLYTHRLDEMSSTDPEVKRRYQRNLDEFYTETLKKLQEEVAAPSNIKVY
jgi:hypothetical protein